MQAPLTIPLKMSPALRAVLVLTHLLPVFAVWASTLPAWASATISLLVLASAIHHVRQMRRERGWCITLHASGEAQFQADASARSEEIRILPASTDLGWLIVLCWQHEPTGPIQRHALCRDAYSINAWRDLRRWVRWQVVEEG